MTANGHSSLRNCSLGLTVGRGEGPTTWLACSANPPGVTVHELTALSGPMRASYTSYAELPSPGLIPGTVTRVARAVSS